jgi:hypothetical protein
MFNFLRGILKTQEIKKPQPPITRVVVFKEFVFDRLKPFIGDDEYDTLRNTLRTQWLSELQKPYEYFYLEKDTEVAFKQFLTLMLLISADHNLVFGRIGAIGMYISYANQRFTTSYAVDRVYKIQNIYKDLISDADSTLFGKQIRELLIAEEFKLEL